jgi:hypothetical protein
LKLAADSSSFAKRYIEEYGSDKLDELLGRTTELGLCIKLTCSSPRIKDSLRLLSMRVCLRNISVILIMEHLEKRSQ